MVDAVNSLVRKGALRDSPIHGQVAAISVGIWSGQPVLDLDYAEDSEAETDMNIVMNNGGGFIEVQGTAEGHAFRRDELDELLNLAANGCGPAAGAPARSLERGLSGRHASGDRHRQRRQIERAARAAAAAGIRSAAAVAVHFSQCRGDRA